MDSTRLASAIIGAVSGLSGLTAYATIVGILFICGLGIPIPEDITLLAAGFLAGTGAITLTGALLAGFFGVMLGDALLFFLGRRFGKRVFLLPGLRRLMTPERVVIAEAKIRKNGPFICFVARFLPGLRSPVFAMAGAMGVKPSTFFLLDGFAALISVPVWVYLGYLFGNNLEEALAKAQDVQGYVLGGIAILITAYIAFVLVRRHRRKRAIQRAMASVAPSVTELEDCERVHDGHP